MKIFDSPDGSERVLIVQRSDGRYTYRKQVRVASGSALDAAEWTNPGPDAGIYDSFDTAEAEARQRVSWLKALFH